MPSENPATPDPVERRCTVRRFRPNDAPRIVQLVRDIYGDTYYPPTLYDAEQIARKNDERRLVSVVSTDSTDVVGHYALELLDSGTVAEASDAIVAVAYRHHHLMEDMRVGLHEAALERQLIGLVGYPVTNHPYSQQAEEHFGAHPCGIALGLWPESFHNMPEPLPQRMSFVLYFQYLRPPAETLHAATCHDDMLQRITGQWNITVRRPPTSSMPSTGAIVVEHEPEVQTGTIRITCAGADTPSAIRRARDQLVAGGARAIILELPLAQPASSEICSAVEKDGFFFCGLGPTFLADGDALLLQFVTERIDPALVQVHSPFARELLKYVAEHGR